jgi:two-component system sensor histidine kinase VicK
LIKLFKYQIASKYAIEFKETYSLINIRQVKLLATVMFVLSVSIRMLSIFYAEKMKMIPNIMEYNISNFSQIVTSTIFILLSSAAIRSKSWSADQRNILTLFFTLFLLGITFFVSYIYSMHNAKNTLTVFLIGVVMVSIFFSLEIKYISILAVFVIFLFSVGMVVPSLSVAQQLFNIVAGIIMAFVLYTCSRYSYYYKSGHFIQLRQLGEKNEEILKLNQQKSEILGFVAHDLRSPLNNIEALSSMIIEEEQDSPRPELIMILDAAAHAKHIINDLVEVVQEGKKPLQIHRTDIIPYLRSVCDIWASNAEGNRQVKFFTEELSIFARIHASKFTRVIDNLIGNGLKFSPGHTAIEVIVATGSDICTITIRDFGIGIPEHLQQMLFDQFSKAGRPGLRGEKSIGLGLHISKNIIEDHGGTIKVNSKENEGTAFIITLPLLTETNGLQAAEA